VSREAEYRLPRTVRPSHYDLRLAPDLASATFAGSARVDLEVLVPVERIVLNAVELEIVRATLVDAAGRRLEAGVRYEPERERASLTLAETAAPGRWRLETEFRGVLNDELRGFYRSTYRDRRGEERVVATTQFEATDARRAFPCWDEPDLKATFALTLVVDEGLFAVANGPEIGRRPLGDGKVEVRFGTTMRMSTYLVAFVVGELEATDPVDVDGVPLRVVHQPGQGALTGFALEVGAHALRYFTGYFDIPYPGGKLDMVAIPDFAWGAMENLGAITFRETALLVDREQATQAELTRVADVIAHEIAHMWFGDLVTMKWWNGIWLNEAFATFAEMRCVDAYRPDWKRWLAFAAARSQSMEIDALAATRPIEFPVGSPEEANEMFDVLTYQKGASVLRMLERYLGEETFRRGIARYLATHAYGNTETRDLWDALEAVSGEPVAEIMDRWIFRGGFPQLTVSGGPERYEVAQRQFRYRDRGDGTWIVPVLVRSDAGPARHLLRGRTETIVAGEHLVANAGGDGFYRVRYLPPLREALLARVTELEPAERYAFVADTWAAVLRGDEPAAGFLDLVERLGGESEPDVWGKIVGGLGELDRIVLDADRPALQDLVRRLVTPGAARLGWTPAGDEGDRRRRLRGLLLRALGTLGADDEVRARSRELLTRVGSGTTDAEVADAALGVVAAHGDLADFERFVVRAREATNPQDVVKYLRAAAAVPDVTAAERLFHMVLDGTVRRQDSFWVLALLLGHRDNGPTVWSLVRERWDAVLGVVPPATGRRILDLLPYRSEPDVAADIAAWLEAHPIPGGERYAAQQTELMWVRVGLREREAGRLAGALRRGSSPGGPSGG